MKQRGISVSASLAAALVPVVLALTASGADQPTEASGTPLFQKPAWLSDLSLGVAGSYDDNLYGVSGRGPMAPQTSWVTTFSPKLGVNLAPVLGHPSTLQGLSVEYAPEVATYYNAPAESYAAHRVATSIQGQTESVSFRFENALNVVEGSDQGPIYSGDDKYRSVFGSMMAKERRLQIQDREKSSFEYDWDRCFVRPTASVLAFDMMTELRSATGYQNYPSRYDANGGVDFGYRVSDGVAITVGARYGHQYQQMLPYAIDTTQKASSSDYERALFGLEGKPWKCLTLALQGGPDFRSYAATAAVSDRNPTTWYGEAVAGAELTPNDSLSLKCKAWQFVSFTGRVPCFDSNYELCYRRKLTHALTLDLAGRVASLDFTSGSDPKGSNLRNDGLYTISPGLAYAITPNLSANLAYSVQLARNLENNPPGGAQYRDYDRDLVSCGVTYRF
jgi:opacity protein-like surface antigen